MSFENEIYQVIIILAGIFVFFTLLTAFLYAYNDHCEKQYRKTEEYNRFMSEHRSQLFRNE